MGDYTKQGEKIGTCGAAYYATKQMLEEHVKEFGKVDDASWYLDPKQSCSFAFPFPDYDNKKIGEISNFHDAPKNKAENDTTAYRKNFYFDYHLKGNEPSFHKDICTHLRPDGASQGGINVFYPCPHHKDGKTSTNFDKSKQRFRLVGQSYFQGELMISGECIYCGTQTLFELDEALEICKLLIERAESLIKPRFRVSNMGKQVKEAIPQYDYDNAKYIQEMVKRILNTYN